MEISTMKRKRNPPPPAFLSLHVNHHLLINFQGISQLSLQTFYQITLDASARPSGLQN